MDWMEVLKRLIEYYNEQNKQKRLHLEVKYDVIIICQSNRRVFEQAILDDIGGEDDAAKTICGDWFTDGVNHCNP